MPLPDKEAFIGWNVNQRAFKEAQSQLIDFLKPIESQSAIYATEELLQSSKPEKNGSYAKTLDIGKIWVFEDRNGVKKWHDVKASELERANQFTKERIDLQSIGIYNFVIPDKKGNLAFGIRKNGDVEAFNFLSAGARNSQQKVNGFQKVWADKNGNLVLGIKSDGTVYAPKLKTDSNNVDPISTAKKTLSIIDSDTIMHLGDSMTAAHTVAENKAYICQLSQLSPFRHFNYSVENTDLLDMQNRVINNLTVFDSTIKAMKPKYLFISSYANDWPYVSVNMEYYQENTRRLIDVALAYGVQPVLIGYFMLSTNLHQAIKSIADEYQIPVIWNDVVNKQIGFYDPATLFHQWHTGTRTGALWWMPMFEYVKKLNPMRTLKIFRKRATFAATTDADLLFKNVFDKAKKWQEINVGHYSMPDESRYDEIGEMAWSEFYPFQYHEDEYEILANKKAINFNDYSLIEIGLDAFPQHIDSIEINLNIVGSPVFYVRNNIAAESTVNRSQPTDPIYIEKWNKPRGAWRGVDFSGGKITITSDDLNKSMIENKIYLMIKGVFSLTDIFVDYVASQYESYLPVSKYVSKKESLGAELLAQPLIGNSSQLSGWSKNGTVNTLIPIDAPKSPRKPNQTVAVDGVAVLTTSNYVQQTVTFAMSEDVRTFKVVAWARYFPKAFLDLTKPAYSSLDATQIIDRSNVNAIAPINKNSLDLEEIRLETWGDGRPNYGGAAHYNYVGLMWRPVTFYIETQPYDTSLSIQLNAKSGEIQLAKCSIKEVL